MQPYIVEVPATPNQLSQEMARMRTWLDYQRFEPDTFRHSAGHQAIFLYIGFKIGAEAAAFAREFGGRILGVPCGEELTSSPLKRSAAA